MMAGIEAANTMAWQKGFAAALIDTDQGVPSDLKAWNKSDPAVRFAVYRNNVVVNLIDGLCETFPVCLELVGEEFFRAMCDVFVRANPPSSRILSHYGAGLPAFIDSFEPAQEIAYLGDVARLEAARVSAYHAADAAAMEAQGWAAIDPADLSAMQIVPHPSAQLLCSEYAVFGIWAAHQGAGDLADIDINEPENVLVIRPQLDVEVMALPPGGLEFLDSLRSGGTMELSAVAASSAAVNFDLAANLGIVMNSGFAISVSEEGKAL